MIENYTCLKLKKPGIPEEVLYQYIANGKKKLMNITGQCTDMHVAHPVKEYAAGDGVDVIEGQNGVLNYRYKITYDNGSVFNYTWAYDRNAGALLEYCDSTQPADSKLTVAFHGYELFHEILESGMVENDDGLPVSSRPHMVTRSTKEMIRRIIMREDKHSLPCIYISITNTYNYLLDPEKLAEVYSGYAHVLCDASDDISWELRYDTFSRNPFSGSAVVMCPGSSRLMYISPRKMGREAAENKISYKMREYMQLVQIPEDKQFLALINGNLEEEKKGIEEEKQRVIEENEQIYDTFGFELEKAEEKAKRILEKNVELERENHILRMQLSAVQNPALLNFDHTVECYPGETREIILDCLHHELKSVHDGSRRKQLIEKVLKTNGFDENLQKRKKDEVKNLFRKYDRINPLMEAELKKLGFQILREENHIVMKYRDCPQRIVFPKTPSDDRSMSNLCMDIIRKFF